MQYYYVITHPDQPRRTGALLINPPYGTRLSPAYLARQGLERTWPKSEGFRVHLTKGSIA